MQYINAAVLINTAFLSIAFIVVCVIGYMTYLAYKQRAPKSTLIRLPAIRIATTLVPLILTPALLLAEKNEASLARILPFNLPNRKVAAGFKQLKNFSFFSIVEEKKMLSISSDQLVKGIFNNRRTLTKDNDDDEFEEIDLDEELGYGEISKWKDEEISLSSNSPIEELWSEKIDFRPRDSLIGTAQAAV